jgi:hypothetical protein
MPRKVSSSVVSSESTLELQSYVHIPSVTAFATITTEMKF